MTAWRNLGPVSRGWLQDVGVEQPAELARRGAAQVFLEVRAREPHTSLNLLWALEGAIQDCDWRQLSEERREQLRAEAGIW